MRLRHAHEPTRDPPEPGVIERSALDTQRAVYVSDRVLGKTELAKKLGACGASTFEVHVYFTCILFVFTS